MPLVGTKAPLNRRGTGPGIIIVTEDTPRVDTDRLLQDWAREGFAVAHVTVGLDEAQAASLDDGLDGAIDQLLALWACSDKTRFGIIAYLSPRSPSLPAILRERAGIAGMVLFNAGPGEAVSVPVLAHLPGGSDGVLCSSSSAAAPGSDAKTLTYPGAGAFFAVPGHPDYDVAAAGSAHERTLAFLKPLLGGPVDDETDEGQAVSAATSVSGHGRSGWFPNMKTLAPTSSA